jgi:hypothetical protein
MVHDADELRMHRDLSSSEEHFKDSGLVAGVKDVGYLPSGKRFSSPFAVLHRMAICAGMIAVVNDISYNAENLDGIFVMPERKLVEFHLMVSVGLPAPGAGRWGMREGGRTP